MISTGHQIHFGLSKNNDECKMHTQKIRGEKPEPGDAFEEDEGELSEPSRFPSKSEIQMSKSNDVCKISAQKRRGEKPEPGDAFDEDEGERSEP